MPGHPLHPVSFDPYGGQHLAPTHHGKARLDVSYAVVKTELDRRDPGSDEDELEQNPRKRRCLDTSGDSNSLHHPHTENSPEQTVPSGGPLHNDGLTFYGHPGNAYGIPTANGLCPPYYAPQGGYYGQPLEAYQPQMGYS